MSSVLHSPETGDVMELHLWQEIERQLLASSLNEDERRYVRASCVGAEALDAAVQRGEEPVLAFQEPEVSTASAWLQWIEVEGFRGIGPKARLELTPGPGLTLVVGRNGSGKSSLAEGVEVVLGGESQRWVDRENRKEWEQGWKHLARQAGSVACGFQVDGLGEATRARTWDASHKTADAAVLEQDGYHAEIAWEAGLDQADPVLTYAELGKLADAKGVDRYKKLAHLLGLGAVRSSIEHLSKRRTKVEGDLRALNKARLALLDRLAESDDDRASSLSAALNEADWKTRTSSLAAALDALEERTEAAEDRRQRLQGLAALVVPTPEAVAKASGELQDAIGTCLKLADSQAATQATLQVLLEKALALSPEESCPTCLQPLPADWSAQARDRLVAAKAGAVEWSQAQTARKDGVDACRLLIKPPPAALAHAHEVGGDQGATAAWSAWAAAVEDAALASHMVGTHGALHESMTVLKRLAQETLDGIGKSWRPLRVAADALLEQAQRYLRDDAAVGPIKKAETWLKDQETALRRARLDPISKEAIKIWETLRQDSGVELQDLVLRGTTNAALDLKVQVDGQEAPALAVMSQGELNALSLALFLPRATVDTSPFRFVLLDDPVQAMDPHKVDGLAELLLRVAETRQVVVFTHDPRLWEAVRRMGRSLTCIQVTRGPLGQVRLDTAIDPVEFHLREVDRILGAKGQVGEAVCAALVPGLCRLAVEAHLTSRIRGRELGRGGTHQQVDDLLDGQGTKELFATWFFGDPKEWRRAGPHLAETDPDLEKAAVVLCRGAHAEGFDGTSAWLLACSRRIIELLT